MSNIYERVCKILNKLSGMQEIDEKMSLIDELGFDSLLLVTLLIEIEEEFQIQLEETDMNPYDFIYVSDIADMVERYVGDNNE